MSKPRSINKSLNRARVVILIENGRKEITDPKELQEYSKGSLISYTNHNEEFRKGGFVWKVTDDFFIYLASDFVTKKRVHFKNVAKMYVGDVYSVKNDIVSIVKTDKLETKYPVEIGGVVVFYAKSPFEAKRIQNTNRCINMIKWIEIFGANDDDD